MFQYVTLYSVDTPHKTPRLAVRAILSTDSAGFLIWLGVLCSTWSVVSRGSTLRTWLDPHGDLSRGCVVEGNIMVGRWANRFETMSFYVVEMKTS